MKKKVKGFTLVELIVVIAIIGVLAAILVPNMMGYISKSKLSSANTAAKNVQTAVVTWKADQESMGKTSAITAKTTAAAPTASSAGVDAAIYNALAGNSNIGVVCYGETTDTPPVVWAQWADSMGNTGAGKVWGQYPNACADYTEFKAANKAMGTYVPAWSTSTPTP